MLASVARWLLPLATVAVIAGVWLTTLPQGFPAADDPHLHPSGLVDRLLDDSGEFVIAWHTWGVAHPPGYPLLGFVANVLTRLMERVAEAGRPPETDGSAGEAGTGTADITSAPQVSSRPSRLAAPVVRASLVSWLFAVLALILAVLVVLGVRAEGQVELGTGAAAAALLYAFGGMAWLYSVVAEVYSFALFSPSPRSSPPTASPADRAPRSSSSWVSCSVSPSGTIGRCSSWRRHSSSPPASRPGASRWRFGGKPRSPPSWGRWHHTPTSRS